MSKFNVGDRVMFKSAGSRASKKTVVVATPDSAGAIMTTNDRGQYCLNFEDDLKLVDLSCCELVEQYIDAVDRASGYEVFDKLRREMREAVQDGRD